MGLPLSVIEKVLTVVHENNEHVDTLWGLVLDATAVKEIQFFGMNKVPNTATLSSRRASNNPETESNNSSRKTMFSSPASPTLDRKLESNISIFQSLDKRSRTDWLAVLKKTLNDDTVSFEDINYGDIPSQQTKLASMREGLKG